MISIRSSFPIKHKFWAQERNVSRRRFFYAPKTYFLFPLTWPCFTGMGRSDFFFNFPNSIPIKINCKESFHLQKIKYTNNLLRIFFKDNTVYIWTILEFANELKNILTENWNNFFGVGETNKFLF